MRHGGCAVANAVLWERCHRETAPDTRTTAAAPLAQERLRNRAEASYAAVPGRFQNLADGTSSFAADQCANALHSGDVSVYCNRKDFQSRASVFVVRVQNMIAISAKEMTDAITSTGHVALYGIFFDTGKADIKPESRALLTEIANLMKSQPQLKLHVVGHTDSQGSVDANFDLSKRRAMAVKTALASQYGVSDTRTAGHGVAHLAPVASNVDDAGRAKNRRVELVPFSCTFGRATVRPFQASKLRVTTISFFLKAPVHRG
jgi:flagellar motor protein MotB